MGETITLSEDLFVSFEPLETGFQGFTSLEDAIKREVDIASLIGKAAKTYGRIIKKMRATMDQIEAARLQRRLVPARKVWRLGQQIYELRDAMKYQGIEIDGLYTHLVRDLGVKRKWLQKVVILRRYVSDWRSIPTDMNWGRLEKGTRRKAQKLSMGLPVE